MSLHELEPPSSDVFDLEPCAMPHEHQIRALLIEQDIERAKLRGRIYQLERIIEGAGLTPLADDGESMAAAYHAQARAVAAVFEYFGAGSWSVDGLPPELRDVFRPLVIT